MKIIPLFSAILADIKTLKKNIPTSTYRANINDGSGTTEIRIGNIIFVCGYFTITPSGANKSTIKTVKFGTTIPTVLNVVMTLAGQPQIATLNISVVEYATTSFTAHIFAGNTTTRGIRFIAVGKA